MAPKKTIFYFSVFYFSSEKEFYTFGIFFIFGQENLIFGRKRRVLDEFSKHFSRVGEPNTANANRKHEKAVLDFLSTYDSASVDSIRVIDVQLLHECDSNLKLHKAAAHDGIYTMNMSYLLDPRWRFICAYCLCNVASFIRT